MSDTEALKLAKWIENLTKDYGIGVLSLISAYAKAYARFNDKEQARNYVELQYIPNRLGYKV